MTNPTNTADDEYITTFAIKNSNGLSGGRWNSEYNTREQAGAAIAASEMEAALAAAPAPAAPCGCTAAVPCLRHVSAVASAWLESPAGRAAEPCAPGDVDMAGPAPKLA